MDNPVEMVDKQCAGGVLSTLPEGIKPPLGIFAKEPLPGRVKTRLSPPLTPGEAAALYRVFLQETVTEMLAAGFPVTLCYDGSESFFRKAFPGIPLLPQGAGDLGERMERALRNLLAEGAGAAALIGTDTPDLPAALVAEAFDALRQSDSVVSPAQDGGYVLIGVRRHIPHLFREVPWSTGRVLPVTRQRAAEAGAELREIGGWEDVDELASLHRLIMRSPGSEAARFAAGLMARHGLPATVPD